MKKITTKTRFTSAIIKLLKNKPLEKITVKEIVDQCGLTRQSFYMNFCDKFDLVNQIFTSDAEKSIQLLSDGSTTWEIVILSLLKTMKIRQNFYVNALKYNRQNSLSGYLAEYAVNVHSKLLLSKIENSANYEKVSFAVQFHAYGFACTVTNWALTGMKIPPKELSELIMDNMPDIMKQYYLNIL